LIYVPPWRGSVGPPLPFCFPAALLTFTPIPPCSAFPEGDGFPCRGLFFIFAAYRRFLFFPPPLDSRLFSSQNTRASNLSTPVSSPPPLVVPRVTAPLLLWLRKASVLPQLSRFFAATDLLSNFAPPSQSLFWSLYCSETAYLTQTQFFLLAFMVCGTGRPLSRFWFSFSDEVFHVPVARFLPPPFHVPNMWVTPFC